MDTMKVPGKKPSKTNLDNNMIATPELIDLMIQNMGINKQNTDLNLLIWVATKIYCVELVEEGEKLLIPQERGLEASDFREGPPDEFQQLRQ